MHINSCANRSRISATLPHFSVGGNHIAFVDEWPHLGHIITTNRDDNADIISKRNTLCGQINNALRFFGKRDPVTKLSLLRAYCSSFYGSVVWDLSHSSIDAFCAIWCKSLRRIWNLLHTTHWALLPQLCGSASGVVLRLYVDQQKSLLYAHSAPFFLQNNIL